MLSAKIKAVFILYLIAFISSGTKIIQGKGALSSLGAISVTAVQG